MNWLNEDWKNYLEKGDKVLFHTSIDKSVVNVDSWLVAIIFSLFFGVWCFGFSFIQLGSGFMATCIGILFFVLFCLIIKICYSATLNAVHYVLTSKGVYKISGLINKRVKFVPYKRITDAEMTRGIIGHMFDTANIGVCTASGNIGFYSRGTVFSQNEIDIRGIKEYKKVRQLILGKIK